ncbi:MAG: hypothetical protein KJ772_08080, partial [Proteobacteria bacterium]|nr:hypothetical protein [Pseudomonadota bacterium]
TIEFRAIQRIAPTEEMNYSRLNADHGKNSSWMARTARSRPAASGRMPLAIASEKTIDINASGDRIAFVNSRQRNSGVFCLIFYQQSGTQKVENGKFPGLLFRSRP